MKFLQQQIRDIKAAMKRYIDSEFETRAEMERLEEQLETRMGQIEGWTRSLNELSLSEIVVEKEPGETPDVISIYEDEGDLESLGIETLRKRIERLESELRGMQVNLRCIGEWQEKRSTWQDLSQVYAVIDTERSQAKENMEGLVKKRHDEFMAGLLTISQHLRQMYSLITMGGTAELELVDSLDPFSEGILFSVMPPRKTWKTVSNLSGGEKTLASLALVFALHCYRPCPIYVMDEIDAALDFRNVSIVASYIRSRTNESAQFIVISLRNDMFEQADRLVGIYKPNNQTRAIAVDPRMQVGVF